jgi:hypothetical protein
VFLTLSSGNLRISLGETKKLGSYFAMCYKLICLLNLPGLPP